MGEKVPLVVLAAISSAITLIVQQRGGAVSTLDVLPWTERAANALAAYVTYLGKMLWPANLAVFYPYPRSPAVLAAVGAVVLAAVSVAVARAARARPYLAVGWFWYVGTLVPVIGLVQVGTQAMADRYTYVPLIGVFIAIAWGATDLASYWPAARRALPAAAVAVVIACAFVARNQVQHWKDSLALWTHAVAATTDNPRAHNSLGAVLGNLGRTEEAVAHFTEALRLGPDASEAHHVHHNLGRALADAGKLDEAVARFTEALRLKPDFAEAHTNLGLALVRLGRVEEAIGHYRRALEAAPDLAVARDNLSLALNQLGFVRFAEGRTSEALALYGESIDLKPDAPEVYNNRGFLLAAGGRMPDAIKDFTTAVRLRPDFEQAHLNLGLALGATGRLEEAAREFAAVLAISPANERARRALDALKRRGGGGGRHPS